MGLGKSSHRSNMSEVTRPPSYEEYNSYEQTDRPRNIVKQWVDKVTRFSSEYDQNSWCADCVIGPPKVYPRYGDTPGAWASCAIDSSQFLELRYKDAVYIEQINIYETYNAGGVKRILARRDGDGDWQVLWKTDRVKRYQQSKIFSPPIVKLNMKCTDLRIEVDCSAAGTWVEIDAVEIVGVKTHLPVPPGMEQFSEDLSILVNNEKFSDVQFYIGDRKVYAHKAILMARSHYFKAMFCDAMKEATAKEPITLKDVDFEGFYAVLYYLYTNQIPTLLKTEHLVDVWRVADRFSLDNLKCKAAYTVCENLDSNNVVKIYCAATNSLPIIDDIRECCVEFMKGNMSSVVKTKTFEDLPKDVMLEIIQMTNQLKI